MRTNKIGACNENLKNNRNNQKMFLLQRDFLYFVFQAKETRVSYIIIICCLTFLLLNKLTFQKTELRQK